MSQSDALIRCQISMQTLRRRYSIMNIELTKANDKISELKKELANAQRQLGRSQSELNEIKGLPTKKRKLELEEEEWRQLEQDIEKTLRISQKEVIVEEDILSEGFERMSIDY